MHRTSFTLGIMSEKTEHRQFQTSYTPDCIWRAFSYMPKAVSSNQVGRGVFQYSNSCVVPGQPRLNFVEKILPKI